MPSAMFSTVIPCNFVPFLHAAPLFLERFRRGKFAMSAAAVCVAGDVVRNVDVCYTTVLAAASKSFFAFDDCKNPLDSLT